jgi:hypothetical protein
MPKQLQSGRVRSETPTNEPGGWRAIILQVSVASVLSGGVAYLGTTQTQSVAVGANTNTVVSPPAHRATTVPPVADSAPAVDSAPVRFRNPFDLTEVFEFPPGTSETAARQAVADLLLQRAADREKSWSKIAYQRRKTAHQVAPVTITGLSPDS